MSQFDSYKIQVKGDDGKPEAKTIEGTFVGPFGVSRYAEDGFYRTTHRHSGLKFAALCGKNRDDVIRAAKLVLVSAPWWASYKVERIAAENNMSVAELKRVVESAAFACHLEGEPVRNPLPEDEE